MKIALLYLGRTGAGPTYSIEYVKALLQKDVSIYAIVSSCAENIDEWRALSKCYGTNKFLFREIYTYSSSKEFICKSLNLNNYFVLIKTIKRYAPDCIVSTMVHPWHNVIFFLLRKNIKRIKIIHDVRPHRGEDNVLFRILNYLDIHISDYWIVLTQKARDQLVELGINNANVCVIPHANFACYAKNEIKPANKVFYRMAFIGRINKYKGLDVLLEAFRNVRLQIPNLRLRIAGNGDCTAYQPIFDELADSLDLDIRWIPDNEISNKLYDIDFVVLPYTEATQSGVIPLAYAFGKTVIATNVGGLSEQVPENVGILIQANNRMALENALNSICEVKWKYENKVPSTFKEWIESSIIVKKKEVSNRSKVS